VVSEEIMMKRYLLVCLLALAAACAHAGMGVARIDGAGGPVTVFYPTSADDRPVQRGPFTLQLAVDAPPARGNDRLVVISHGSGGAPWTYVDLAHRLVAAGFIVAAPEHQGDNWHDMSKVGPASWKQRPLEVSRAIDLLAQDARFAPLFAPDRVGMYGMSAGGHTALTLAGGRWSPARLREHCQAHLEDDFHSCVGLATQLRGNVFDGLKKAIARTMIDWKLADAQWYAYTDPRITAVIAEVPYAVDFDLQSLATPKTRLGIVQARKDPWLTPKYHSMPVIQACKACETVADLADAGHGSLLSPQPRGLAEPAASLLADPPGFERAEVGRTHDKMVAFFRKHLLP
jgi:predicted dienelactone hydrolase